MGNRGHVEKQARARELRAQAWTLQEICDELGCSKSSASLWTRGVEFTPKPRSRGIGVTKPHPMHLAKLAEIERFNAEGREVISRLSEREFLAAGLGLYAGDGSKGDGSVQFSNSNPLLVAFFCCWFRAFFDVDETRLRAKLYLHAGLDLDAAETHWAGVTGVPVEQFNKPYRAVPDHSIRHSKHRFGCAHVLYNCSATKRKLMGLMRALVSSPFDIPG